jgi:NAD(P)-dependent dehydrogenase (short-subunit alcohol dehydrogenase family)
MATQFSGKVAVITGASRGIGRAIAEAFAREGAQTALVASSPENLEQAAKAIAAKGLQPLICAADLRQLESCEEVFARVRDRFDRCDILINCAGATQSGNFLVLDDALWTDGFALKFFGAVRLTRLFWPMLKTAQGSVVNIIGGAARTPNAEFLIGGSVNAALANFSKGLSVLGNRDGVNVNAIHPGSTQTERIEQIWRQTAAATGKTPEQIRSELIARTGIRRLANPEDVAELAVFLCSERARHIQGVAIAVDGGQTPGLY